jgi:rsbT co-antagonist protein RsbR
MLSRLKLDDAELRIRRAFFEITDDDLSRLSALRKIAEKHMDGVIEGLYQLILGNAEARRVFKGDASVHRAQVAQRAYFLGLFAGRCDMPYLEDRLRIGVAHEREGVPPKWYLGAYSKYVRLIFDLLAQEIEDPDERKASFESVLKLVTFDMALAMDTYLASQLETIARHQAAIRELSTPVIQIHDRILLLPLIGTIDTHRAQQIMERVLERVVEEQARVMIIDIAGVAVVDTKVAEHLIETTRAVRLLGAETILTGISPTVAKTVVKLGVDISSMHTRSRLSDGIELAQKLTVERTSSK